jgi:hypothetical protein
MLTKEAVVDECRKHAECRFRFTIYQPNIEAVIDGIRTLVFNPAMQRLRTALQDLNLLVELGKALDDYVVKGVIRDADLVKGRLPLKNPPPPDADTIFPSNPPPRQPAFAAPPSGLKGLFRRLTSSSSSSSSSSSNAAEEQQYQNYQNYFSTCIENTVNAGGTVMAGRDAFFARYRLIQHALTQYCANFSQNLATLCTRLSADWDQLDHVFFDDSVPVELVKIEPAGSDFHKGGQQVLILTFRQQNDGELKLVYKPSDLELDYRLVADTDHTSNLTNEAIFQNGSAAELFNIQAGRTGGFPPGARIATYRILPKKAGSSLARNAGSLPIRDSYGYLEFLTHSPATGPDGRPLGWKAGQSSDWVVETDDEERAYYDAAGAALAFCSMFSITDMHYENMIVHEKVPHLIDVEVCFRGATKGVKESYALDGHGFLIGGKGQKQKYVIRHEGRIDISYETVDLEFFNQNRIYRPDSQGGTEPSNWRAAPNLAAMEQAMDKSYEVFAAIAPGIIRWFTLANIPNAIARIVVIATREYHDALSNLFYLTINRPVPTAATFRNVSNFDELIQAKEAAWRADLPPIYAVANWRDSFESIVNLDIPTHYHRLNDANILNSHGEPIAIPAPSVGGAAPASFFPRPAFDDVSQQIQGLADPANLKKRKDNSIADVAEVLKHLAGRPPSS